LAYVDDSTAEEIAAQKGTPTEPGTPNQYRSRTVEENLQLFAEMKAMVSIPMALKYYALRSIWHRPTCTFATH
jgi:glutamyl/glutaminyl-tRNA synthetase